MRIAIAEVLGWELCEKGTLVEHSDYGARAYCEICQIVFFSHNPCFCETDSHVWTLMSKQWKRGSEWSGTYGLPNYPESLDACAEFEATLDPLGREQYVDSLATVVNDSFAIDTYEAHWNMLHATALQRCEAFLKCKEIKT